MIIHDKASNNFVHCKKVLLTVLTLSLALFLSACGKESTNQDNKATNASSPAENLCEITIDSSAWQVFAEFCDKANTGSTLTRAEFQVFADLPIVTKWKESQDGTVHSVRMVNWLEAAFSDGDDHQANAKHNLDRRDFRRSFRYSIEHSNQIKPLIQKFPTEGHSCGLREKINFWISAPMIPDSLVIAFIPSKPEIRILENYFFVDTGVLQAGNLNQLERQLTGMLFRATMLLEGEPPTGSEGELAVAHSVRMMMNEGFVDYIQDLPNTLFSPEHSKLSKVNIVPEFVFDHGRKAIGLLESNLPKMFADDQVMLKNGRNLAKTLIASSSLRQGGYSMTATIAAHLGDERLRETIGSPAQWLAAYQEAARMNPSPAPEAYEVSMELHLCMPPLQEDVYLGLQEILGRVFPPTP